MDVSKFVIGSDTINVKDASARSAASSNATAIGTLANLTTSAKTDLVSAINEVDSEHLSVSYTENTETISFT